MSLDRKSFLESGSFFARPIYYRRTFLFFTSPSLNVTQTRGHYMYAGSSLTSPSTARAFAFFIVKIVHDFLPSSTRVQLL